MVLDQSFQTADDVVDVLRRQLKTARLQEDANRLEGIEVTDSHTARVALLVLRQMGQLADSQAQEWKKLAIRVLHTRLERRVETAAA